MSTADVPIGHSCGPAARTKFEAMAKHLPVHATTTLRRPIVAGIGAAVAIALVSVVVLSAHAKAGTSTAANSSFSAAAAADEASAAAVAEQTSVAGSEAAAAADQDEASSEVASASASSAAAAAAAYSAKVAALTSLTTGLSASAVSVAAINLSTGMSYESGATGAMNTGSIVKLYILETLLLQRQDDGGLSEYEQETATAMIENSDNDAAETLFEDIGGRDALIAANSTLGLTNTTPGPDDYWGLTQTSAADYVTLLSHLTATTGSPLTATSQAYVLGLMRNVESDQRWGVGAASDAGTDFANKNGWLGVDEDNGLWLVNSTGVITINGQTVLMAVLTQHNSDFQDGIDLVESLAKALGAIVAS